MAGGEIVVDVKDVKETIHELSQRVKSVKIRTAAGGRSETTQNM